MELIFFSFVWLFTEWLANCIQCFDKFNKRGQEVFLDVSFTFSLHIGTIGPISFLFKYFFTSCSTATQNLTAGQLHSLHTLCLHSWPHTISKFFALNFSLQWLFHIKFGKHKYQNKKITYLSPLKDRLLNNLLFPISLTCMFEKDVCMCTNYIHILIGIMLNIK